MESIKTHLLPALRNRDRIIIVENQRDTTLMQLEFAVLCDYAGYTASRRFIVVGPALGSVRASLLPSETPVSLAAAVRLAPGQESAHTFRVDATGPDNSRFAVTSEQPLPMEAMKSDTDAAAICNLAVPVGGALESPGDYILHLVIDGRDVKTLPLYVSHASAPSGEAKGPSISEIDEIRRADLREWLELERQPPSDEMLGRIAAEFSPPAEWFDEEDLFEPPAEAR